MGGKPLSSHAHYADASPTCCPQIERGEGVEPLHGVIAPTSHPQPQQFKLVLSYD